MGDLLLIIADRNNLPFHYQFRTIPAIAIGLAMKQPAGCDVGIQLFDDLSFRINIFSAANILYVGNLIIDCKTSRKKAALAGKDRIVDGIGLIVNPEKPILCSLNLL